MTNKSKLANAEQLRDIALAALEESKAEDVKVLDVTSLTDITDYMIVATGTSDRHVRALANNVLDAMREAGQTHLGIEGEEDKDWILVDFVDIVVHLMRAQTRSRYDLESLWDKTFGELAADGTAEEIVEQQRRVAQRREA